MHSSPIIKEEGNQFVINGDSQTWTEEISRDQVLGVAEGIVRKRTVYFM